ncbi:hypothetical protein B0T16DRAFT_186847 [Cercophora newfieldiana]|uniref:Zn(2)-C6 fungal-type domain-containing protein n=1 Tax=Cercophora newfieldiana TaxID=92897 RepID=A0AA39Y0B9_9PEZI|nr:hypothetical protein B0T16DRAFT_186847 [Cercophora newfieldiana]
MREIGRREEKSSTPFGHRPGVLDLARLSIDLTWARADSESTARLGSYPSPPMSGSPPLPPKASQEAAERIQGTSYQAASQDVYRGSLTSQGEERAQTAVPGPSRHSPPGTSERVSYAFPRLEGTMSRPLPYPQQLSAASPQAPYRQMHGTAPTPPLPAPQPYSAPAQQQPGPESLRQPSPKPQRKTKGHVASACVPCKRAHLRCDAQRPCSRCMTNGKEDLCIDVQHKKRGRPRLRDDGPRFGSGSDAMRRPMGQSLYGPGSSMAEPIAPRFSDRALASDANIFPAPLSIPPRAPELRTSEPAAFLTVDFEFGNASTAFLDAVARPSVKGMRLADLVAASDRDKVSGLQRQVQDERQRKDPTYLPPMFGRENAERVMQRLGFSSDELSRYAPDWPDHLNFLGQDGQPRQLSFRMALAKVESVYIVLLWLNPIRAFQYPTPSPNPREPLTYSYQPNTQHYSQPTPVSATFEPRQPRPGESGGYGTRAPGGPGVPPPPPMGSGLSPGLQSTYSSSPSRPEYPIGSSYQIAGRPPPQGPYQLPPIRNQEHTYHARDDRSRVDIGGLLDRSGPPNKPQQP